MKINDVSLILLFTIVVGIVVIGGSNYFLDQYYPDDNLIEENLENVIESELGLKPGTIDLTPESQEAKQI